MVLSAVRHGARRRHRTLPAATAAPTRNSRPCFAYSPDDSVVTFWVPLNRVPSERRNDPAIPRKLRRGASPVGKSLGEGEKIVIGSLLTNYLGECLP